MEKIIIVWEKEALSRIDIIKNIIASNATEILIINPESPDYEEIIKKANNSSVLILNDTTPKTLKKEITEEFNKVFELKSRELLDVEVKSLIDETPRYDRFLKKWKKDNRRPANSNSKKKWNR
jgi:hypothetical protein